LGRGYYGWQRQPDCPTIQRTLEEAISRVVGENIKVKGASRTDAGVHALGQVANFVTNSNIGCNELKRAINANLPKDIFCLGCEEVAIEFDAKKDSKSKLYRYVMFMGERNPFLNGLVTRLRFPVNLFNLSSISIAISYIQGKHDFASFRTVGSSEKDTVKNIFEAQVFTSSTLDISPFGSVKIGDSFVIFQIEADSFLRRMVRNIVGALILVGLGKMTADDFKKLLDEPSDKARKFTAPPDGLYLVMVKY
jgi:tRNA pseudouridine38-40 synthase